MPGFSLYTMEISLKIGQTVIKHEPSIMQTSDFPEYTE